MWKIKVKEFRESHWTWLKKGSKPREFRNRQAARNHVRNQHLRFMNEAVMLCGPNGERDVVKNTTLKTF